MALVDVLIPTCDRKTGLATVLTSLVGQSVTDFDVTISDQSEDEQSLKSQEIPDLAVTMWTEVLSKRLYDSNCLACILQQTTATAHCA